MAKRKAHLLASWGNGNLPEAIVCVQAAAMVSDNMDADPLDRPEFAGWQACVMMPTDAGWKTGETVSGHAVDSFWRTLATAATGLDNVWLVSCGARELMAILGLWEMVLDGSARVCGHNRYASGGVGDDDGKSRDGYVILEGPPTVVKFQLGHAPTQYTWVDPANYGATDLMGRAAAHADEHQLTSRQRGEAWLDNTTLLHQVEQVNDWLSGYLDTINYLELGGLEHTSASQAMAGFRRSYMREKIYVHDNEAALKLERSALYGGRNECRYLGTVRTAGCEPVHNADVDIPDNVLPTFGKIYHLDVNSLYPAVAANASLPTRLIAMCGDTSIDVAVVAARRGPCVARVLVQTEIPCVPVRHDDQLLFPTGTFWTSLCGPELLLAHQYGTILKCSRIAIYEGKAYYAKWVADLYAARLTCLAAGDHDKASCIKSLLNASFGKWSQLSKRWVSQPDDFCPAPFSQWWQVNKETHVAEQWRSFAWNVQHMVLAGEPPESCPIITATVHSLARVRLWRLLETAGMNNVYYYDTDSVWCNHAGYSALAAAAETDAAALGKLKVKGEHREVTWWGQKRYAADGQLTMSGAPLGSVRTGDAFATILKAPPLAHYLCRDMPPGTDRHVAKVRISLPYKVGTVQPTGDIIPLILLDDPDYDDYNDG